VYHCTPSELDAQDAETVSLHLAMLGIEADNERAKQGKHHARRTTNGDVNDGSN
jgi:hypothetical protein